MSKKGRGKGPGGMTRLEAICQVIEKLGRATGNEIFNEVKMISDVWKDHAILQGIMQSTINLQPAYYHWPRKQEDKCLFLCGNGYFERYDQNIHGIFENGIRIGEEKEKNR